MMQRNELVNELKNKKTIRNWKNRIRGKYQNLQKEHEQLSQKLSDFEKRNLDKKSRQQEFSEKLMN